MSLSMFTAYVVVTVLTAVANASFATLDFMRLKFVIDNMTRVRVPPSWLFPLGALKMAGGLGILIGIGVPLIGIAASAGLALFFVGAIVTHVRAHDYTSSAFPAAMLLLAAGSLVLRLAAS